MSKFAKFLPLATGEAPIRPWKERCVKLIRHGCVNRPFFHITVMEVNEEPYGDVIELLGSYDPLPNMHNEKLVAINFERLYYWLKDGAHMSEAVKKLLGIGGYLPIHPLTYEEAWLRRKKMGETLNELKAALKEKESQGEQDPKE